MTIPVNLPPPAKSRRGESFTNGKLYHFDDKRILVAKPWPEMRAWYKTAKLPWQATRRFAESCIMSELFPKGTPLNICETWPLSEEQQIFEENRQKWLESLDDQERLNLHKPSEWLDAWSEKIIERRHLALSQFFDAIPDLEREFVLRFGSRRWHLLALFARCPGAFELAQSNPALAYALSSNWVFHQPAVFQPMRAARALVKKKQRDILAWLGFPETEQARKILAKIPPEEVSLEGLLNLRRILACPTSLKLLSHAPIITSSMLLFLNDPGFRPWLTPIFVEELSSYRVHREVWWEPTTSTRSEAIWEIYKYLRDFLRMQEQVRAALRPLRSISQLKEMHDEAVGVYNATTKATSLLPFPAPPYPGKKILIEPITCDQILQDEGLEMGHCVGSYTRAVQLGEVYVYQVLSPVRATLSIRRHTQGWQLDDIRGMSNQKIPIDIGKKLYAELLLGHE